MVQLKNRAARNQESYAFDFKLEIHPSRRLNYFFSASRSIREIKSESDKLIMACAKNLLY